MLIYITNVYMLIIKLIVILPLDFIEILINTAKYLQKIFINYFIVSHINKIFIHLKNFLCNIFIILYR